ncbi:4-hydroxy-tetrahydrodipicolinate synthase [Sinanaerobacter chloroacetimidivorans]|uniref:4-hydroxy-tetrahydrodipicolinate synthase n=1 Tax=Sinanaerobacter chloroacetimidivorans TaxID=2818044 RepID=A0A8J7W216_9FIRM|nr:4-hydroxy-tetrahydrodipicolinate synthase [Sinanaerobacter chloroacetimidivorans]MBR0598941.1 4-hydroxy-tetrahydrodipicolinate synthase [Sinanaerobacter chloroacetimidivorans]
MIKGSMVALITPFHEDGSVNYDKLDELIRWHIEEETDGIVILGTTAETPALTVTERDKIVEVSIAAANKRIPIIVGSGSNNTLVAKEQSMKYESMGADGLLVITPYYNKTNKAGMIHHFTEIADAVSIPIILYNVPGRTGCSLSCEAVKELSKHQNIVGIKEASGDISFVSKISRLASDNFAIYSGNDDMIIPLMSLGGLGVISVAANIIPREMHRMTMAYLNGDVGQARDMQLKYLDFINALFIETNPIPIKEAMNIANMNVGKYRLPLYEMENHTREQLLKTMKEIM